MIQLSRCSFVAFLLAFLTPAASLMAEAEERFGVLVFSRTAGFRHGSIEAGREAISQLGRDHGFRVEATEDPTRFSEETLAKFRAVVFLNTTGNVLSPEQKEAFESFIRAGGGFVGIHAAADTEYEWEWYGKLVGAYFKSHPRTQEAVIQVEDRTHPATSHLADKWKRRDEWYNFRANPREHVHVLLSLDTGSFEGSEMGDDHPIAWWRELDGGRAFYTGLGHTEESFREKAFLQHLLGAIQWAAGADSSLSNPRP
jgi:cytochrome c